LPTGFIIFNYNNKTIKNMKTLLWLDDVRDPNTNDWLVFSPIESPYKVHWVKDYGEFVDWIVSNGLPSAICFDHDLGDTDDLTGYDAAKWLVNYCIDNNKELPKYNIQSANPVGKDNINGLLNNFNLKFNTKEG
jgi:hypothetical protein